MALIAFAQLQPTRTKPALSRRSPLQSAPICAISVATYLRRFVATYETNIYIDFETRLVYISHQPCSSRGVSGDSPVGGARRGVPRL